MLTSLQERIARLVFASSPDADLALAGGAALISLGLVNRSTIDLDLFTPTSRVHEVVDAVIQALERDELTVRTERTGETFVRLVVADADDECQVDFAQDFRLSPASPGPLGPTLSPEELAADKTLALFTRAEPRDYVDVYFLAGRFGKERLLELASDKDLGFDRGVFAQMLSAIDRLDREEFAVDDSTLEDLRTFFAAWRGELLPAR